VIRRELSPEELGGARATLAALRDAQEVRDAVAEPPSASAVRKRLLAAAGYGALGVAAVALSAWALTYRVRPKLVIILLGGVVALGAGVRDLWIGLRLRRNAGTTRLVAIVARSQERSANEKEEDRYRVTFESADGERIVLRGLASGVWARLRPGSVGVLWVHGTEFVDFRELGSAVADATPDA
jgi:hypothetical protein